MNNQLKNFLYGLLYMLVDYRMQPSELRGNHHDWAKWGRIGGRIQLACDLGLITLDQQHAFQHLLTSASDHMGKPFPHRGNVGPVMPGTVALDRRLAATAESKPAVTHMGGYDFVDVDQAKPSVRDAEPVAVEAESKPKEGWAWPLRARKEHYFVGGLSLCGRWAFGGRLYDRQHGVDEQNCTGCIRPLAVKPQAQGSANDRPCAVSPAPIASQGMRLPGLLCPQSTGQDVRLSPTPACRQLRLLCVLVEPQLGASTPRYLPFHTMHRVPPRAMVKGKWSQPRYAGLYLRETHATVPTAEVLERCARHRQTNALRAATRAVRAGGVSA